MDPALFSPMNKLTDSPIGLYLNLRDARHNAALGLRVHEERRAGTGRSEGDAVFLSDAVEGDV